MELGFKRFNIFAGNYGSGKTELSLNTALMLAKKGNTVLVDMDIVNPYFRSAESAGMLEENGVRLIAPPFANTTVDVPALSAEVYSAFESEYAVFDAGGDPVGATALGGYRRYFDKVKEDLVFFYVVNARRPFQADLSEAVVMLRQIEANSRLKIDYLINNTNLAAETSLADLAAGDEMTRELSEMTGIPVAFASGTPNNIASFKKEGYRGKTFEIKIFTRPDWLDME